MRPRAPEPSAQRSTDHRRPLLDFAAEASERKGCELFPQARQFEARTGKPYLIQSNVGDTAYAARKLYTYMMADGAVLFPDAHHIRLNTPIGIRVATLLKRINEERVGTQNMDTPAAIAAFINGEGGIYPTGTWMIGSFQQEATSWPPKSWDQSAPQAQQRLAVLLPL